MPTRTARTDWTGTLEQGVGRVELTSSKLGTFEMTFPRRAADDAEGVTSPEELIAAAHSACYSMQLSHLIAEAGSHPGGGVSGWPGRLAAETALGQH
jgi:osmotically inducible protein OsmC